MSDLISLLFEIYFSQSHKNGWKVYKSQSVTFFLNELYDSSLTGFLSWHESKSQTTLSHMNRGGSRAAATSKMEHFVIIVNGWKPLLSQRASSWMLQQGKVLPSVAEITKSSGGVELNQFLHSIQNYYLCDLTRRMTP